MESHTPNEALATRIAHDFTNEEIRSIRRFPTGLVHHVYDITTEGSQTLVVRMSAPHNRDLLRSGLYWSKKLKPLGLPLPKILHHDTDAEIPYVLLERLPGRDLGDVYSELTAAEKQGIAEAVSRAQNLVAQLPPGPGFGFASSYETDSTLPSWRSVVEESLARSRSRIDSAGIVEASFVDAVEILLPHFYVYLDGIQPIPFLDDTTTKNVIVSDGKLTGIVDVDQVCFGDPLFTVALTRMALMSAGAELDYVEYWCDRSHLNEEQRSVLALYTALFCVDFMSEIGQVFNKENVEIDLNWLERLKQCHAEILRELINTNVF